MATQLNQKQSQNSDRLPSQTVQNPKNVSAITLRSGKQIDVPTSILAHAPKLEKEDNLVITKRNMPLRKQGDEHVDGNGESSFSAPFASDDLQQSPMPLPFPPKLIPSKKMEEVDKEILYTFWKVEVNIPLLDAIKQISKYAKFLKELCTHKRKMKGHEQISMDRN